MAAEPVVRLFGFRPTRPAFDNVIRDWMVPAISARRGVVRAFAGRHGPDELGPRLVLSVWESRDAMDVALDGSPRPGEFRPEGLDGIAEPTVEVLSPRIAYLADRTVAPPRIIRVLRGCARQGKLNQYVEETRAGVAADVAAGHGPAAFYLAEGTTAEAFVTVSVWAAWSAIELATGSDIHRPLATRRPELIDAFEATHYEAIDL